MATLSGTIYAAFGLIGTGNLGEPNASNALRARLQADGFALNDSKNADFSGTGTTVTFNASAIAWAAINQSASDIADLNASDHADLSAGIGTNTHSEIDTHLGLTEEHYNWENAVGTIHTDNYVEGGPGKDTDALHDNVNNEITGITNKATPVAADEFVIEDSAASYAKKAVLFSALEGALDHDNLSGVTANEHLDWTGSVGTIHTGNYVEGGPGTDTDAYHDNIQNEITATTAKTTCADADEFLMEDSAASFAKKAITFANLEGQLDHDSLTNFAIGEHRIINDSGTSSDELWSASKINTEISAIASGVDWQESVLDIVDNTAVPPGESEGDRYILDDTGSSHANWDGADPWDVVQFISGSWVVDYDASTQEGGAAWVEDVNTQYIHNGTAWVVLAGVLAHNSLSGLDSGDYQHLTSAEHGEVTGWTAGSDITAAEMEDLTDGSDAGSLHIHDSDYYTETEIDSVAGGSEGMTLIGAGGFSNLSGATVGAVLDDIDTDWDPTNWDSAYSHISANGSSHGYLDQSVISGSGPAFTSAALTTPTIVTKLTFDESTNDLDVTATDQTSSVGTANFPDLAGATVDVVMRTISQTLTNKTIDMTDNTLTGTLAEFNTACSDDNFAYLGQNNIWTAENQFDTLVLKGDGGSPETFGIEIKFTVLNPGSTVNAGDLVVIDAATGDVQPRSAATQIPIGTAVGQATQGDPCYVTVGGLAKYNTADSPSVGDELFVRNESIFDTMTTTPPSTGKSMMPCMHYASGIMFIGFWSKLWEFET